MHGPIPMKLESCRAEMLRVCLSPAHMLRLGSVQATVVGLRTFGRRTHEDEWDEVRSSCFAIMHDIFLAPQFYLQMPAAVRILFFIYLFFFLLFLGDVVHVSVVCSI